MSPRAWVLRRHQRKTAIVKGGITWGDPEVAAGGLSSRDYAAPRSPRFARTRARANVNGSSIVCGAACSAAAMHSRVSLHPRRQSSDDRRTRDSGARR